MKCIGFLEKQKHSNKIRIRVLARIVSDDKNHLKAKIVKKKDFRPNGKIFVPYIPDTLELKNGDFITANYDKSDKFIEEDYDSKRYDKYVADPHSLKFHKIYVVKEKHYKESRPIHYGLPLDVCVYIKTKDNYYIGPWQTHKNSEESVILKPKIRKEVYKIHVNDIDTGLIIKDYDSATGKEYLLEEPSVENATLIDASTNKQLTDWLVNCLISKAHDIFIKIDKEIPGWRQELRKAFEKLDPNEVEYQKWDKVYNILKQIEFEHEQIVKLNTNEIFKKKYDNALIQYRSRIEEEIQEDMEKKKTDNERKIKIYETKNAQLKKEIEKTKKHLKTLKEKEDKYKEIAKHLDDARERIVKDYTGIVSLLNLNYSENKFDYEIESQPPLNISNNSPIIEAPQDFINNRLYPSLNKWVPGINKVMAEYFNYAILCCKGVFIPDLRWAIAYKEAVDVIHSEIIQTEPTWLTFSDAWKSGLNSFWLSAIDNPDYLHLLILQDINRSLFQCWARPILDMIAGYREYLPTRNKSFWPDNLRILAIPVHENDEKGSFPLLENNVRNFAAIEKTQGTKNKSEQVDLLPGHVPFYIWQNWKQPDEKINLEIEEFNDWNSLSFCEKNDLFLLNNIITQHRQTSENENIIRKIRLEWPKDYFNARKNDE